MVDALNEAWRVLIPGGVLLDLRPLAGVRRIEAVTAAASTEIARLDASSFAADDAAADAAIDHAMTQGWFRRRHAEEFDLRSYWDTAADLKADVESGRPGKHVDRPYEEIEAALQHARASGGQVARLRYWRRMILRSYARTGNRQALHD